MKYCHSCGAQLPDDAQFCISCGARQYVYEEQTQTFEQAQVAAPESAAPSVDSISAPTAQPKEKSFKKFVDKVTTFENKHNVIVNAIMLACAFIIALVALFAPVKVEAYYQRLYYTESNGVTAVTTGATIDQSIFQILGSTLYFNASDQTKKEMQEEYYAARQKASEEYNKWIKSHPGASDEEIFNKHTEITAKYLSDVNYFGMLFMQMTGDNILDNNGIYINALITVIFGWVVAILSNIMAVMSVVQLIFAIINMAKKKPQTKLYKYFMKMLGLSTAGLSLLCCAPMFKAGGGMLAIALLISLVFLACGVIGSLLKGTHFMLVIKRGVCALVALIGYFVLFTEVFTMVDTESHMRANVASGYGLYSFLSTSGPHADLIFVGLSMYLLVAAFLVSFSCEVLKRSLRRLAFGGEAKKTKYSSMALTAAIFAQIVIVLGLISGAVITSTAYEWLCRGGIWVNLLFMVGVYVFGKVFLPNDKIKGKEQPVQEQFEQELPPQEPPVQNSLMQQAQNTYKPFM